MTVVVAAVDEPPPRVLIAGISAGLIMPWPDEPTSLELSADELSLLDRAGDFICVVAVVVVVEALVCGEVSLSSVDDAPAFFFKIDGRSADGLSAFGDVFELVALFSFLILSISSSDC